MIFTAPAYLTGIRFTKDKALGLTFVTQELSDEDKIKAARFHGSFGWIMFSEAEIQEDAIPADDPVEEHQKTPAQRLRAVLFLLWKQTCGHTSIEFDDFYKREIERIITVKKALLED